METHVLAHALEHYALEIVVQQRARYATKMLEGFDVPPHKALHSLA